MIIGVTIVTVEIGKKIRIRKTVKFELIYTEKYVISRIIIISGNFILD